MASRQQLAGMRGVYLVASELSRLGFIASPTSRSAIGADILVTDQSRQRSYSAQVKTNARTFNFWLLSKKAKEQVSPTHIYLLVNIRSRKDGAGEIEYYVVPSADVAKNMVHETRRPILNGGRFSVLRCLSFEWSVFGEP